MVIPVHDINPLRRVPWATYGLVAVNVVVFLLTPGNSGSVTGATTARQECRQLAFYDRYAAIPTELTHNKALPLVATGAAEQVGSHARCFVGPPSYHKVPFLSAVTSQFVHGGWLHLLGNMLFLIIFGNNVEDRIGRVRYVLFYLAAGLIAAYGFALANPTSQQPLLGASGAIAGILGAYLIMFPRAQVWSLIPFFFFIPLRLPAWPVLGGWFLLQWAYASGAAVSSAGNVAYLAHGDRIRLRPSRGPPHPTYARSRRAAGHPFAKTRLVTDLRIASMCPANRSPSRQHRPAGFRHSRTMALRPPHRPARRAVQRHRNRNPHTRSSQPDRV